jgi:hypothetical protein
MIDATTHTRKIWRSHFDGADSTNLLGGLNHVVNTDRLANSGYMV